MKPRRGEKFSTGLQPSKDTTLAPAHNTACLETSFYEALLKENNGNYVVLGDVDPRIRISYLPAAGRMQLAHTTEKKAEGACLNPVPSHSARRWVTPPAMSPDTTAGREREAGEAPLVSS